MFRIALLALCFVHKSWADNAGCDARPAFRDFHPLSSRGLAAARRAGFAVTRAGLAFIVGKPLRPYPSPSAKGHVGRLRSLPCCSIPFGGGTPWTAA